MSDDRTAALNYSSGSEDPKLKPVQISFCESSASLQIDGHTIHIPWLEIAAWVAWLAAKMEEKQ